MVRIRLKRVGKSKQASYRVVVADQRSPRDGRIIEAIGRYNPRVEPSEVAIDAERARYWIERGAQPSDQVRKLLEIAEGAAVAPAAAPKPTPAESVTPTRAGSVDEPGDEEGAEASEAAEAPEVSAEPPAAETEEAETGQEGPQG